MPDDTRKHVAEVLDNIFSICEGSPVAVFTDNAHKDKNVIGEAFEKYYDGHVLVLQVSCFMLTNDILTQSGYLACSTTCYQIHEQKPP